MEKYDPLTQEIETLDFWKKNNTYQKIKEKNKKGKKGKKGKNKKSSGKKNEKVAEISEAVADDAVVVDAHDDVLTYIVDYQYDLAMEGNEPDDRSRTQV